MNQITYRISLDMRQTESGVVVKIKRDDTIKKLVISLTDGGKPYHITEECYAVFAGEKPNGDILLNDCTIDGCAVTYEITPQNETELGEVKGEIRLYGTDRELGSSPTFTILIVPPVYDDDRVIESHDEVNALTDLITSANDTIQKGEEVAQRGEAIFDSLQDKEEELSARAEEIFNGVRQTEEDLVAEANEVFDGLQERHKQLVENAEKMFNGFQDAQEKLVAEVEEVFGSMPKTYVSLSPQNLTPEQETTARLNINAADLDDLNDLQNVVAEVKDSAAEAVLFTTQVLTEKQKADARSNIGAIGGDDAVKTYRQSLNDVQKAQARDNIGAANVGDIPKSKVYEHIATITVAPAEDGSLPQYVTISADSEGKPFELSDFIIKAHAGFASGNKSTLYMDVNGGLTIANGAVGSIGTSCRYFTIFCRTEADGCIRAENTASTQTDIWYNAQADIASSRLIPPMHASIKPPFTKVRLYTLLPTDGAKAWVEGSKFELWGVRV